MCLPLFFACSFSPFLPQPTSTATTLPGTQHSTSTSTLFHTDTFLGLCFLGNSFFTTQVPSFHLLSLLLLIIARAYLFYCWTSTLSEQQSQHPHHQAKAQSYRIALLSLWVLGFWTLLNTQRFSYFWNPSSPSSRAVRPSTWPRPCSLSRLALFTASRDTRTRFCFRGLP